MYEVIVSNYVNTVSKSWKALDWDCACDIFIAAMECEDCKYALLVNGVTDELYIEYNNSVAIVHNLPEDDKLIK